MLTFEDVRVTRGDFTLSADLAIETGARIAILGPSGAGKSTLLALVGGFLTPDSGRITWGGTDITDLTPSERPVATIFQDNNLFPHLTVTRNVGLGLRPNGRLSADDRARVADALRDVGLAGMGDRKPGDLSGGQQSRVALARAGLQDKPILLLDEAFSALGPALKSEMIDLVLRLAQARDLTLLMITHDPDDARRLKGQTIVVADGRAHQPQDTDALLADPPPALGAYLAG
ncbi:ATP-binding cassette domain-containing protein [Maribius pontilimi]|uniref:ATP-binding cassette domain-containing protein n=1 Tax=Palleronia pontilimi TaxID=1964209 RepID=A0A934IH61_9RHOB|nr:ATP-binding cassette domain-containing protein [Palleronia pontilimi]MBJ3763315.1 ATP-binding cassette domain-containing protein [Palleronia pontilimi]